MTSSSIDNSVSYPGIPTKAQYKHCPACHDHATTLQTGFDCVLYCPNCGWNSITNQSNPDDITDTMLPPQAAATRQIDNLEDIDWTTSPGTPKLRSATYQAPDHPAQVEVVPGGLSTAGINYQLIPPIVWERGAKRFMLGEERKGDKAWNADSPNQHILTNKKFILDRLAHTMAHTLKLMDKIRHDKDLIDDDDAAAIWWGASFAICATEALTKEKNDLSSMDSGTC